MPTLTPEFYNIPEIILTYKTNFKASERPQISCIEDACEIFSQAWDDSKLDFVEEAKVMLLNRANRLIGICNLSSGGITGTVMDERMIFAAALKANASQVIVAHNHPSDNLTPSVANRRLTEKLRAGGDILGINVLDHIIVCKSGYYSMNEDENYQGPSGKIIPFPPPG